MATSSSLPSRTTVARDGAIRFADQARTALQARNWEQSYNNISRCQKIIAELTSSLKHDVSPELCGKLAGLYNFAAKNDFKYILTGANYSTECVREPLEWHYHASDLRQLKDIGNYTFTLSHAHTGPMQTHSGGFTPEEQARIAATPGVERAEFVRSQTLLLAPDRPAVTLLAGPVDAGEPRCRQDRAAEVGAGARFVEDGSRAEALRRHDPQVHLQPARGHDARLLHVDHPDRRPHRSRRRVRRGRRAG